MAGSTLLLITQQVISPLPWSDILVIHLYIFPLPDILLEGISVVLKAHYECHSLTFLGEPGLQFLS